MIRVLPRGRDFPSHRTRCPTPSGLLVLWSLITRVADASVSQEGRGGGMHREALRRRKLVTYLVYLACIYVCNRATRGCAPAPVARLVVD